MAEDAGLPIDSRLRSLPRGFGLIDLKPVTRRSEHSSVPNFGIFDCSITIVAATGKLSEWLPSDPRILFVDL